MEIDQGHGYDVTKSQVSEDRLCRWLVHRISEDLGSVPGIGPMGIVSLDKVGVRTTFQLIGIFLSLREPSMDQQAHCQAMWEWLEETGVNAHRSGVVHCMVEKLILWMPELYLSVNNV
jgi:hypothetical protein